MIYEVEGVVGRVEKVQEGVFYLSIHAPSVASCAKPGEFVLVRVSNSYDPLLRRPLSIAGINGDFVELLFAVVGRGTTLLSEVKEGDLLSLRGPLGRGFPSPQGKPLLVAGGMGVAPLLFAHAVYGGRLVLGVKDESWKGLCDWVKRKLKDELTLLSEDGSLGLKGTAVDGAEELSNHDGEVWACGPKAMLLNLYLRLRGRVRRVLGSLEERMACGIGGCYGCSIETKGGMRKVCYDGPVFDLGEVFQDER